VHWCQKIYVKIDPPFFSQQGLIGLPFKCGHVHILRVHSVIYTASSSSSSSRKGFNWPTYCKWQDYFQENISIRVTIDKTVVTRNVAQMLQIGRIESKMKMVTCRRKQYQTYVRPTCKWIGSRGKLSRAVWKASPRRMLLSSYQMTIRFEKCHNIRIYRSSFGTEN